VAWPTRSKLLAIRQQSPTAAGTKYSAGGPAAGKVWLIKAMRCYNGHSGAVTVVVYLRRGGIDYPLSTQSAIGAGLLSVDPHTAVAEAGDELFVATNIICNNLIVTFHGALLG
jgi:hypothetical protein